MDVLTYLRKHRVMRVPLPDQHGLSPVEGPTSIDDAEVELMEEKDESVCLNIRRGVLVRTWIRKDAVTRSRLPGVVLAHLLIAED